jgi:hypothetical protein
MLYGDHFFEDDDCNEEEWTTNANEPFDDDDIDDMDLEGVEIDNIELDDFDMLEEELGRERGIWVGCLEIAGTRIELTMKVTPRDWNGERQIDITDAFDIVANKLIDYPRAIIPPERINELVENIIWGIENDPDLSEEERKAYLSDLR